MIILTALLTALRSDELIRANVGDIRRTDDGPRVMRFPSAPTNNGAVGGQAPRPRWGAPLGGDTRVSR
jgi:hypothetical protein